jgi:hypothetical protein
MLRDLRLKSYSPAMQRISRILFAFILLAFSLAFNPSLISQRQPTASFDAPLKKKVVDFGPSPYYPSGARRIRVKLSCFFYPAIIVKEYDEGQKGAEWLAIAPIKEGIIPSCVRSHSTGERVIEGAEWSGYFSGVKGNLAFFDADDGTNGGIPFVVYDSITGKKVFEDSAYNSLMWKMGVKIEDSAFNTLRVSNDQVRGVSLKYLRVVEAGCDLNKEKTPCWERIRKKLEVKTAQMPICTGYEHIMADSSESALAYPVEVLLSPQPVINTIPGPVKCWPVD